MRKLLLISLILTGLTDAGVALAKKDTQGLQIQGLQIQGLQIQGTGQQGLQIQGTGEQGLQIQGVDEQGLQIQGLQIQGLQIQGLQIQGLQIQGVDRQGLQIQGLQIQGPDRQGLQIQGLQIQGLQIQGLQIQGLQIQGLQIQGLQIQSTALQGLQIQGLQIQGSALQRSSAPGTFIFVPTADDPNRPMDLRNTFWEMPLTNGAQPSGHLLLFISDVEQDKQVNSSKYPSNDDIFLYTAYYRHPATLQWASLCPMDPRTGKPTAMAIPLDTHDWNSDTSRKNLTFACTASGVGAKCARNWGYKPWKTVTEKVWNPETARFEDTSIELGPLYDACVIAARADYCQDGQSFTRNGTLVDLFDTLDGFTSINATVGLPYARYSSGPMMHEEYQISTAAHVFTAEEVAAMSLPEPERSATARLLRSGMQSSRYADRDPGRSCFADPHIDRCDPTEPYACYRATNLSSHPYGAFIAVNSPRHCSHDEVSPGEALDPLCNECVNRVCQVDPTCCADPGTGFYPGSLVWDDRCSAIRKEVCRSLPRTAEEIAAEKDALEHPELPPFVDQNLWPPGETAPPATGGATTFLSGAIGALEGIRTDSTTGERFAEGWACDPDFPSSSIPVQISIGAALGSPGTPLLTATASEPLAPSWNSTVSAACGAGRHGFRVLLPATAAGQDIYAYGIDLNVPGAPFTLLRGGQKRVPGASPSSPRTAIWSGWVSPATSGDYQFVPQVGNADKYRLWVNGIYVAGNWTDDLDAAAAFTLEAPSPAPTLALKSGVSYGVRVEYQRVSNSDPSSRFVLRWSHDSITELVPSTALHPMAPGNGTGVVGTYFAGDLGAGTATELVDHTHGALDFVWTTTTPPAPGLSVNDTFAARFEGEVVPPISSEYTFTADSDGSVRIWIDDRLVTQAGTRPPGLDPETCQHDICQTGGSISRTCGQGYFCAARICLEDPACCSITWDARCVRQVDAVCNLRCTPTPPIAVALGAGAKYRIRIEYQHTGGTTEVPARGANLRVFWSLPGGPRDRIPVERLFSEAPAAALGVGINAAYFSDANLANAYFGHVEPTLNFTGGAPQIAPTSNVICLAASTPACDPASVPIGPPFLSSAQNLDVNADGSVLVRITGGGAIPGATVVIRDGATSGADPWMPSTLVATILPAELTAGGTFVRNLNLAKGSHELRAFQQPPAGADSEWSPILAFVATDPDAPPAPTVDVPASGIVSGSGIANIGGTAAPHAHVDVTVGGTTTPFTAGDDGRWGGPINLGGSGSYQITITQTTATGTSVATVTTAKVVLPALVVDTPRDGDPVTSPLSVQGHGATFSYGPVRIADGDGRSFVDRGAATVVANGNFSGGDVALDYGRHQLKVYQHTNALDGDGVVITVKVPPPGGPPGGTLAITSPAADAIVESKVTIIGGGGLHRTGPGGTGLPTSVIIYQGAIKRGEGTLGDEGSFSVPVTLVGSGAHLISVSQVASSLSGGGTVEGPTTTPVRVVVVPQAPVITAPATGTTQVFPLTVNVAGTAVPGATVAISVDDTVVVDDLNATGGNFSTTLTLTNGTHRLRAVQTVDGAASPASAAVLVSVGDISPPTFSVTGTDGSTSEIVEYIADDQVALNDYDFRPYVTASDDGVSTSYECVPHPLSTFPLGSTPVRCEAVDAFGNRGLAKFLVTVRSRRKPDITGNNLVAEAQSADGAVVEYQVSATGFVAECLNPSTGATVPCTSWAPAHKGLGFTPSALGRDPNSRTLYAAFRGDSSTVMSVLRSDDGGDNWTLLADPGPGLPRQLVVAGSPPVVYLPTRDRGGLKISVDGGGSWTSVLEGRPVYGVAVDPSDPQGRHMFAWTEVLNDATDVRLPSMLFETRDGWATWSAAGEGLPDQQILAVAIDPLNPERAFLSMAAGEEVIRTKLYRRIGNLPWERLAVPPHEAALADSARFIAVAPHLLPGRSFPTVFAGTVVSRDGGATWEDFPTLFSVDTVVFDHRNPNRMYASTAANLWSSEDGGESWNPSSFFSAPVTRNIVQDFQDPPLPNSPPTLFSADRGLYKTTDGGQSWSPILAPELSLPGERISTVVSDSADANTAYVLTERGLFKTTDGGTSWLSSSEGIDDPFAFVNAGTIAVDRFNRNVVYLGGYGLWKSPDGGAAWTDLAGPLNVIANLIALDPLASDTVLAMPIMVGSDNPTYRVHNGVREFGTFLPGSPIDGITNPYHIQVIPDAKGPKVAMSWSSVDLLQSDVSIFSLNATADGHASDRFLPGLGLANVVLDRSDGVSRVYLGGGSIGRNHSTLYRTRLDDLLAAPDPGGASAVTWEELGGGDGFSTFSRLIIDPAGGGQIMYTLGTAFPGSSNGNGATTLWESRDGGHTWHQDLDAPEFVNDLWLSPADGSIYATVISAPGISRPFTLPQGSSLGLLWKRTRASKAPPGARVVQGDVRVICGWPDDVPLDDDRRLRAIGPGSTFPLDDTHLDCVASDVFGNRQHAPITVTVVDTTPPTIFAPTEVVRVLTGTQTSAPVAFAVSASDIVDGAVVPVTCDIPSGTVLTAGVRTNTCRATDAHGNLARASFPVVVRRSTDTVALPTLSTPDEAIKEATGPTGVTAPAISIVAATTAGAPLPFDCTPSLDGTFGIGTRMVSCTTTDPSNSLSVTRQFPLTVRDTTPPAFDPLPDVTASGAVSGARVPFTATATDLVDSPIDVSCTPAPGSLFGFGTTPVTCRASDTRGNRATAAFNVVVLDRDPPELHLQDVTVEADDQTGARVFYNATATDVPPGPIVPECFPSRGSHFSLGDTTVVCIASDADHNESRGSFVVHVVDTQGPTVTVSGPITVEATELGGAHVTFAEATAADVVDGVIHNTSCSRLDPSGVSIPVVSGALFPMGSSGVTCTATDRTGNVGKADFAVVVRDTTAPELTLTAPPPANADATGTAAVAFIGTATDLGRSIAVACNPKSGSRFVVGSTPAKCVARDAAGNESSGSINVVVRDTIGSTCTSASECGTGFCVDGVCCATACGGGDPNDCQVCNAGGAANGTCTMLPSTRVCRDSVGTCDVAETCTGTSATCPGDAFAPTTKVCRGSAGTCDVAETCTGTSPACPGDAFAPVVKICRDSAGTCDVAETCTGTSPLCPGDAFAPVTKICRDIAGVCDVAEKCTGASPVCPGDAFASATTVCRTSAGICDVAERCSGSTAACPADAFVPAGTVCAPAGTCLTPGVCSGTGASCPPPTGCGDTTPPVFTNVPGTIVAFATCKDGATVTYTKPTATDAVDGVRPVTCTPPSGSMFHPNTTTVTCKASDKKGNTATATFVVWVKFEAPTDGSFFLIPIRPDGSSVFRIGRPVPVRFKLTGASKNISDLVARLAVTKISDTVTGTAEDTSDETVDDTDFTFKYRSLLKYYVYRWKTRDQSKGTYQLKADLGDGVLHQINVSLKAPQ